MSSEQAHRVAGMRTSANAGGHRNAVSVQTAERNRDGSMSKKQGPHFVGMRLSANTACRRHLALGEPLKAKEVAV
jgi:hypothetical protein